MATQVRTSEPHPSTLLVDDARASALRDASVAWPSWTLTGSQLAEYESLAAGLFRPRTGYAARREEWIEGLIPSPGLAITPEVAQAVPAGDTLALRDPEGVLLAALHVTEAWPEDGTWRAAGVLEPVTLPAHHDFVHLRLTPPEVAAHARARGWSQVLVFFPTHVLHAGIREALLALANRLHAGILLLVGAEAAEQDELSFFARVRALEASAKRMPADRTLLVLAPMTFPADQPRAAAVRALVARNYSAGLCAVDVTARPADVQAAAADAVVGGIRLEPFEPWGFSPARGALAAPEEHPLFERAPSERQILSWIAAASDVPAWLLEADELDALRRLAGPRAGRGFTVFFTGLSGSGKSTLAGALRHRLMALTARPVTLLDGDLVRMHLSSELGFSREHRDLNVRRIGWVASEITRHGGIAVCAPIAPYDAVRKQVRAMIEPVGGFILVHVATSLEVCEQRDRKGLYARARAGLLPGFTGISDPYEIPDDAAVRIDTQALDVDAGCQAVIDRLVSAGYLAQSPS